MQDIKPIMWRPLKHGQIDVLFPTKKAMHSHKYSFVLQLSEYSILTTTPKLRELLRKNNNRLKINQNNFAAECIRRSNTPLVNYF